MSWVRCKGGSRIIRSYRFDSFLDLLSLSGDCIVYSGPKKNTVAGYGSFFKGKGKYWLAHRLSYAIFVGPLVDDLCIDHMCKNHSCVNPAHLQQVTRAENTMLGDAPPAKNKRKTHCLRGHEFNEQNTRYYAAGYRACRACSNMHARNHLRQKRARIKALGFKGAD